MGDCNVVDVEYFVLSDVEDVDRVSRGRGLEGRINETIATVAGSCCGVYAVLDAVNNFSDAEFYNYLIHGDMKSTFTSFLIFASLGFYDKVRDKIL